MNEPLEGTARVDALDLADEREYAWLLVRGDTLLAALVDVWRAAPTDVGGWAARAFGYTVNAVALVLMVLVMLTLGLILVLLMAIGPVAIFLLVRGFLPTWLWWPVLGVAGLGVVLALAATVRTWLGPDAASDPTDSVGAEWNPDDALNLSHASSRGFTVAIYLTLLCWVLACATVLLDGWFTGPTDEVIPWLLYLSHLAVDTILLGMVSVVVPEPSGIEDVGWLGQAATILLRLTVAAGALSVIGSIAISAFRPRELFNGTVRQLADHVWNTDVSDEDGLTIHRVAVVRPLPENEVLTFSKGELYQRLGVGNASSSDPSADPMAESPPPGDG